MTTVPVTTIGFTNKSAQRFFHLLKEAGVQTLLDVRLNRTSQLSGFAKQADLAFFLGELVGARYVELSELAPEKSALKRYRDHEWSWESYSQAYIELIARRQVESTLDITLFEHACLLCSEDKPHRCHRRLAVEYLNTRWNNRLQVTHLF